MVAFLYNKHCQHRVGCKEPHPCEAHLNWCCPRLGTHQGEKDYDESDLAFLAKKKAEEAALKELKAKVGPHGLHPGPVGYCRQCGPSPPSRLLHLCLCADSCSRTSVAARS